MHKIRATSSLLAVIKSGGVVKIRNLDDAPLLRLSTFIPTRIVAERPKYGSSRRYVPSKKGLQSALDFIYSGNDESEDGDPEPLIVPEPLSDDEIYEIRLRAEYEQSICRGCGLSIADCDCDFEAKEREARTADG